jgi:hypothetical protein
LPTAIVDKNCVHIVPGSTVKRPRKTQNGLYVELRYLRGVNTENRLMFDYTK